MTTAVGHWKLPLLFVKVPWHSYKAWCYYLSVILPEVHFLSEYSAYDCLSPVPLLTIRVLLFRPTWTVPQFIMGRILITFRENWVSRLPEEHTTASMKQLLSTFLCQIQQTLHKWCKTSLWVTSWVEKKSNYFKLPGCINLVSEELAWFSGSEVKKDTAQGRVCHFVPLLLFCLQFLLVVIPLPTGALKRVLAAE